MTRPYLPVAGSHAALVIEILRSMPPGSKLTRLQVRRLAGVPNSAFHPKNAVDAGFLVYHPPHRIAGIRAAWSLGKDCPQFAPDRRRTDRREPEDRRARDRRDEPQPGPTTPAIHGKLRAVMFDGMDVAAGDPIMLLAEARQAAQQVLAHKGAGRFSGAEVEAFVARELRAVSEAAARARDNLRQALEVTL